MSESNDNPYYEKVQLSSSSSLEEDEGTNKRNKDSLNTVSDTTPITPTKEKSTRPGVVGKTVDNLRKSLNQITKNVIREPKTDINLAELEIIQIDDSDDDEKKGSPSLKLTYFKDKLPYFDFMPDEVIFNIFNRLTEKDMGRFAMTCRRLYSFMDEEDIWQQKAAKWMNLRVSRNGKENLRKYYVTKYQENLKVEEMREIERRNAEERERLERRVRFSLSLCDTLFYNWRIYDIPILLLILLWAILLSLRTDEYIICSYHYVFIPLYVAYIYVFFSASIAFITAEIARTHSINYTSPANLLSVTAKEMRVAGFIIVGVPWSVTGCFFVVYAFSLESNAKIFESYSLISLAVFVIGIFAICFMIFLSEACKTHWSDDCLISFSGMSFMCYLMWILVFLALKNEFIFDVSWAVALVPIWMVVVAGFLLYVVGAISTLDSFSDRQVMLQFSMFFLPGFAGFVAWLALQVVNLSALERDEPIWPWTLVNVPIFVTLSSFTAGIAYLMYHVA